MYNIIWIIVIGFVGGIIARFISPGPNRPTGFILTTGLGIAGAFVATFIGQTIGWYRLDQGAGLIGAIVGAVLVLFIWNRLVTRRVVSDPGDPPRPRRAATPPTLGIWSRAREVGRFRHGHIRRQTWDYVILSRA
jgi:uncharacterized membrane protein YeaQ/YmgE (transglycosylase-associated protein family)